MLWTSEWLQRAWPAWTVVFIAAGTVTCLLLPRRGWFQVFCVLAVSASGTWLYVTVQPAERSPLQHAAWLGGALSLLWAACAGAALLREGRRHGTVLSYPRFVPVAHAAALLFAVAAVVVQSVVLFMRLTYTVIDAVRGYPWNASPEYGFSADGLWSLGYVVLACTVSLVCTRDGRLAVCLIWSAVAFAVWLCLLMPPLEITPAGGFKRTTGLLCLCTLLSVLMLAASALVRLVLGRRDPERRSARFASTATGEIEPWHDGIAVSFRILGITVAVLVCYHILVPVGRGAVSAPATSLVATSAAAAAAFATYSLRLLPSSIHLYDVTLGLGSLAVCGWVTAAVPAHPASLGDRYPMVFNAMLAGLAAASACCGWVAAALRRDAPFLPQRDRVAAAFVATRFTFFDAALGVMIAAMMAVWPRLPGIATMDDSYGRVTAGFAANLALLAVLLWRSRCEGRMAFHVLTVLSVVCTGGFLLVRMWPYGSAAT